MSSSTSNGTHSIAVYKQHQLLRGMRCYLLSHDGWLIVLVLGLCLRLEERSRKPGITTCGPAGAVVEYSGYSKLHEYAASSTASSQPPQAPSSLATTSSTGEVGQRGMGEQQTGGGGFVPQREV